MAKPGGICLSDDAYRHVRARLDLAVTDLGPTQLKNIAEPMRLYSLEVGVPAQAKPAMPTGPSASKKRSALTPLVVALAASAGPDRGGAWCFLSANRPAASLECAGGGRANLHRRAAFHQPLQRSCPRLFRRRRHRESHHRTVTSPQQFRHRPKHCLHLQGQEPRRQGDRQGARRALRPRRLGAARRQPGARQRPAH